ncbi:MAG TPA: mannosyltransferase family protein [Solirubrobacteraceae bacterium]|nr:mannosyltransferase family protein [Solirubrobacteraceae bacterium]
MGAETIRRPSAGTRGQPRVGLLDRLAGWVAPVWRPLWASRLLVWSAGVAGVLVWPTLVTPGVWRPFDPDRLTAPFGPIGDLLVAPAARWDSAWYLAIAAGGYGDDPARTAFFPLYPLLVRALGGPADVLGAGVGAYLVAGVLVSLLALAAGLAVVHRLAALELGAADAGLTTTLVALFPTAYAFSAVYSESLFLALSAGALYAGRLGRWRWAGVLAALASATRSTGVLLVVPLALLYLYGPRGDRPAPPAQRSRWQPRHAVRGDLGWLTLAPAGLGAYLVYLAVTTGDPAAPFRVGGLWYREFAGPFGAVWEGAVAALAGARQLASGSRAHIYFQPAGGDPFFVALHNLGDFAFLVFAVVAIVGVLRRLPLAYGAWALCAVALPLSLPVGPEPLASLPRYLAVVFPLHMWLALWARRHRLTAPVVIASAIGLVALTAGFAAWRWVA